MSTENPAYQLMSLFYGFMISEALHVTAELGIADKLVEGPKDLATLAKAVAVNEDALERVLRLLVQKNVFVLNQHNQYDLNEISQLLRSNVPGSLRAFLQYREIPRLNAYRELFYSVKTGNPAFNHIYGTDYFSYISQDEKLAAKFDDFMAKITETEVSYITQEIDFAQYPLIADIGGGRGVLLGQILHDFPNVKGCLVDLPEAINKAHYVKMYTDRCELLPQSFFEGIPEGKDLYIMKQVLHDWDDVKCTLILNNLAKAMSVNSHFLIIEPLKTIQEQSLLENEVDLCLLTFLGGRRRSELEFSDLLAHSGLKIDKIEKSMTLPTTYIFGSKHN